MGIDSFRFDRILAAAAAVPLLLSAPVQAQDAARSCLALVEVLAAEGRVALDGVGFDFNRATLRPDSLPALIAARDAILTLGGDWRIEGHTDSVGSRGYNQTLSEARALAVRDWLVAAGVPAAGLTAQGFAFDRPVADNATDAGRARNRRVELVGQVTPDMLGFGGPEGVDPCPATLTPGTLAAADGAPPPPAIPDWSGTGGQQWLPFSLLMATGYGAGTGWAGTRLDMPPGARPEACQALCTANADCAAFSFEPAGSDFVEAARCALIGYGTELDLTRNNTYLDGGTFYASGLKADARLLTPQSQELAAAIIADLAEIARLRDTVRITAPDTHPPEVWMDVALDGAMPGDAYPSYLEIALPGDYAFDWRNSRSSLVLADMDDGRSGRIWVPEAGDYVLRYVIDHPTAGRHTIAEQPLVVQANAAGAPPSAPAPATTATGAAPPPAGTAARTGTVEPGIDRPGQDIAQTPMTVADPLACQALCAGDDQCRAWTYVNPGLQGDLAMCWTKFDVPEGFANPCCTSGVMDQAATPAAPAATAGAQTGATLDAPARVAPGAGFTVAYAGPLHPGDWIDIITPGDDANMSGGWAWAWAEGGPVTLTAPDTPGPYSLRYVAEDPARGRVVLAVVALAVGTVAAEPPAPMAAPMATPASPGASPMASPLAPPLPSDIAHRCAGPAHQVCELRLPDHDLALSLMPGYGITAPLVYVTPGGAVATRPSFEVIRLSDGVAVLLVNARQAMSPYCQDGLAGDHICLSHDFQPDDGIAAAVVFASLTSIAMVHEAEAMGEDPTGAGSDDPRAGLTGIWLGRIHAPGQPGHERDALLVALAFDGFDLRGTFRMHPDFDAFPGGTGQVDGRIADGRLILDFHDDRGIAAPVFEGAALDDISWDGVFSAGRAQDRIRLLRVASAGADWTGPPWTQGDDDDGMATALRLGQRVLGELLGEAAPADRATLEMLGRVLAGAAAAPGGPDALPGLLPGLLPGPGGPAGLLRIPGLPAPSGATPPATGPTLK